MFSHVLCCGVEINKPVIDGYIKVAYVIEM